MSKMFVVLKVKVPEDLNDRVAEKVEAWGGLDALLTRVLEDLDSGNAPQARRSTDPDVCEHPPPLVETPKGNFCPECKQQVGQGSAQSQAAAAAPTPAAKTSIDPR